MSLTDTRAAPLADERIHYVQWGPIFAGALAAAALAFVLHSFAAAIGIAVSSTAPTWRDASVALWILTGLYLVLVALASFGLGGYVAGRTRARLSLSNPDEIEFRDGTHGLLVWALAIVITAFLAWATVQSVTRLAAPAGGGAGTSASVAGENIIAYDLDRLFRSERRPANVDLTYARSEAARILLTAAGHSGTTAEDRAYLARLTASTTGIAPPEAEKRVETVIASARNNIARARRSAVILAFMAGAAALLGAAVAWFAAGEGGRHRDQGVAPSMQWSWRRLAR